MKWTRDDEKKPGELELGKSYPFEVVEAEERVSQRGNCYINLKLTVFVGDAQRTMYDNIMPQMPDKLRSFCEAMGLIDQYQSQSLSATDCQYGEGFLKIDERLDKNSRPQVKSYAPPKPAKPTALAGNTDRRPKPAIPTDDHEL